MRGRGSKRSRRKCQAGISNLGVGVWEQLAGRQPKSCSTSGTESPQLIDALTPGRTINDQSIMINVESLRGTEVDVE